GAGDVGVGEGGIESGGDEHALAEARMAGERDPLSIDAWIARHFLTQLAGAPAPRAQSAPVGLLARPAGKADHAFLHRRGAVRLKHLGAIGDVDEAALERHVDAAGWGRAVAAEVRHASARPDVSVLDEGGSVFGLG